MKFGTMVVRGTEKTQGRYFLIQKTVLLYRNNKIGFANIRMKSFVGKVNKKVLIIEQLINLHRRFRERERCDMVL